MAQPTSTTTATNNNAYNHAVQMVPTQTGMSFSYTPHGAGYTVHQQPPIVSLQQQQQQQPMLQHVNTHHQQNNYHHHHQMPHIQQQQSFGVVNPNTHEQQQQQMYLFQQHQQSQFNSNSMMYQQQHTPALYHSPQSSPGTIKHEISPDQSPRSEPGTPEKRPKLRVTIPEAGTSSDNHGDSSTKLELNVI